jgi:threonine/homoserine/homoserine lactone efflux protein
MGFLTNLLNPKVAMFYVSLFPQFLHPERGDLLGQTLQLGVVQVLVSGCVNALIVLGAGRITRWLSRSEAWLRAQRWVTGGVLALLALRVAQQERA